MSFNNSFNSFNSNPFSSLTTSSTSSNPSISSMSFSSSQTGSKLLDLLKEKPTTTTNNNNTNNNNNSLINSNPITFTNERENTQINSSFKIKKSNSNVFFKYIFIYFLKLVY